MFNDLFNNKKFNVVVSKLFIGFDIYGFGYLLEFGFDFVVV